MITKMDLLRLDYTPDLTEAGILHTCQWLARSSRNLSDNPYRFLCRKIGQVAVELALRRLLVGRNVPFKTLKKEPFSDPYQHDLSLGGHRLHLNSYLFDNHDQIRTDNQGSSEFLQASAFIPHDRFVREGQTSKDIYLFAFLLTLAATSQADQNTLEAKETENPNYYVTVLPKKWSQPVSWIPLHPIILKTEADHPVTVELGGLNAERNFICAQVQLQPHTRTTVTEKFFSLAYLHILDHPKARLGFHSPKFQNQSQAHIIHPNQWSNVWVCGREIWLTGWMTQDEFRHKSVVLPAGQYTTQYPHTHYKNLCVPMAELHPLEELFEQTRSWQAAKMKAENKMVNSAKIN